MYKERSGYPEDDKGISPVIGIILMVAITVMMAAIVSSWSSGIKAPSTPASIGLDIMRSNNNISIVIASVDPITASPLPFLNVSYQYWDGINSTFQTKSYSQGNVNVGDLIDIDTNSPVPKRVIIIATYKDNSKKVLYSQDV